MSMETLDVGCGHRPRGDVNCDLYVDASFHRSPKRNVIGEPLNLKLIPNFVKCDVQHLPFKDSIFQKTYCTNVIEHVRNPYLLLKELLRVTNGKVIIKCPHAYAKGVRVSSCHLHFLRPRWFHNQLKTYSYILNVSWTGLPSRIVSLVKWPEEITVIIKGTKR